MFFGFVTKHECDRQTDRQNYDPQDRASISASHGKKPWHFGLACNTGQLKTNISSYKFSKIKLTSIISLLNLLGPTWLYPKHINQLHYS